MKKQNTITTATTADKANTFADLMTAYEKAHATGADTTKPLYDLATAVALSVLKKCIDPQRTTATERETVSNNGINPALTEVKRGIVADIAYLEKLATAHNNATEMQFNNAGDLVRVVVDKDADKSATALQGDTLSDGLDLVNTAVVAILEEMCKPVLDKEEWEDMPHIKTRFDAHLWAFNDDPYYAEMNPTFLETPYRIRRICKKVMIQSKDTAKWESVWTTPIQEVYRAVRREIQNSRAMQTDPRNGYTYIEDTATDPDSTATETIYRRLHKWADLGGHTQTGHYDEHGNAMRGGLYTADPQTVADYTAILTALNLTERQATIVRLRMSGYGYLAIGSYLGITAQAVNNALKKIQSKCEKIGFSPAMWAEMTADR